MPNFVVRILQQLLSKMRMECFGINPYIAGNSTKIPNRILLPNARRRYFYKHHRIKIIKDENKQRMRILFR